MADEIQPPTPPAPAPADPTVASASAQATLSALPDAYDRANGSVSGAKSIVETWTDEFWAVSGYNKAAVMAALEAYDRLVQQYNADYQDEAAILRGG